MLHPPTSNNKTQNEANNSYSQPVAENEHRLHPPSFGQSGLSSWGRGLSNNRQENLQKTLGNQAVLRMNGGVLQRKCTCGGSSAGECAECQSKQGGILQTKLSISEPGDRYEQEADRIADQVMRMPEPTIQRQVESEKEEIVQRKAIANSITPLQRRFTGQDKVSEVPPIVDEVLRSPSQPLDPTTRTFMESRFGYDFSNVRVHTDPKSAESAQAINAAAYTVGQHIVFGSKKFAPKIKAGQRLISHELTHVVQQASGYQKIQKDAEITDVNKVEECMNRVNQAIVKLEDMAAKPDYVLPDYIRNAIKLLRQKKNDNKIKCYGGFEGTVHGKFKGDEIRVDAVNFDFINITSLLHEAVHASHKENFPQSGQKYSENEGKEINTSDPKLADLLRWKAYTEYWAYRSRFDLFNPGRNEKFSEEDIHKMALNDSGVKGPMSQVREIDPNFNPRGWKPKN